MAGRMMPSCHECPGLAPEMLVEGHFRSISTIAPHVEFGQHNGCRISAFWQSAMFNRRPRHWAVLAVLTCFSILAADELRADPTFSRDFNGPDLAWQLLDNGVPSKILTHDCLPGGARDHKGLERVAVAAPVGESAMLICLTSPIATLDELEVRLWVKASRPDIQLAARIALPRSLDPQRRTAATTIVKGSTYSRPGHWQELVVADVPKLLAAQIRVIRSTPGAAIDPREAFLDAVVLVVPGDPSGVEVGTDQLEIQGVLVTPATNTKLAGQATSPIVSAVQAAAPRDEMPASRTGIGVRDGTATDHQTSPVRLQGTTLFVEGKPFLPRVIQWNGESLQFLSERGFNVVQLTTPPNAEQIADAQRYSLWFMCVPPRPEALARDGLGAAGDRVLAWCLEDEAIDADPSYAMRWAELIRDRDTIYGRPIIVAPNASWGAASKAADILIARNPRINLLTALAYQHWLEVRPRLVRPGTPLWAAFNTQFGDAVRLQANTLTRTIAPAPAVDAEQLESLTRVACTSGVRGFVFQSSSSLSETDPATRRRAAVLELINRRLQLMEPWLAGGKVVGQQTSTNGEYTSSVLYVDRARLLVPLAEQPRADALNAGVAKPSQPSEIAFLVPGVSESSQVFFLTPAAMRSLSSQRVAGGTRFVLPSAGDSLVVITEDPQVMQSLRQRITRQAAKTVQLQRDLAVQRAQSIFDTDRRLAQLGYKSNTGATEVAAVNARLAQLDSLLNSGQLEQSQEFFATVSADAQRMSAEQRRSVGLTTGLQNNPLGLSSDRLAEFAALQRSFDTLRGGENLLAGGDFENLNEMTQFGWQHLTAPTAGAETRAELSGDQPQHGAFCLELHAAASPANQSAAADDALVWIVSPPIPLDPQKAVEISGWVRVDKPFGGAGEGLAIVDSLGGPELSLVIGETSGWQMFRVIRAAPQPTELRLTFALTGLGAAKVDAVMVRTLEQPLARRLPAVSGSGPAGSPNTTERPGPISRLPEPR